MKSSSLLKIGLGDPDDPNAMIWEEMTKQTWDHSNYRWEMTIHPPSGHPERRSFLWKRTHSVGVEESMPAKLSQRNFKLVDERTGELLAVYANNGAKSWKKAGKLQINKDFGRDWDTMVLLTGLSLLEKERRRSRNSSGGGGGGGGG
ncbi:hypothetical protein ASPWEDRAFT_34701 [Aspergillus wentii DTO 134E9]|uniref:Uncharacterized protein n=1 Tax=Aspergillus wentii DTO 134E9 TaxID=1073089 RepID=A0A1L9S224_ASPWE|nr:uncharacterized protein ASPWEDRAFT_34701 [Aspergillus wentii DTO 134E9]OJJ41203.1 hypothetical protein ASPWEDRAFT_34701 [Aspergillus wentii DTO 134E9]